MFKDQKLIDILNNGGIAVIPTDTIYGIVGDALNKKTVERIYKIKKRTPEKPLIILISEYTDLEKFGILINSYQKKFLSKYWPGPVSVALPSKLSSLKYLDRGTGYLAFRMPNNKDLQTLISNTRPIVAPSANPEGETPASNIKMATKYFGKKIDYYLDEGHIESPASTLVLLEKDKYIVLREGVIKIK